MSCRDSVNKREAGGGGTGRRDSKRVKNLPDRAGNLADRNVKHNRRTMA